MLIRLRYKLNRIIVDIVFNWLWSIIRKKVGLYRFCILAMGKIYKLVQIKLSILLWMLLEVVWIVKCTIFGNMGIYGCMRRFMWICGRRRYWEISRISLMRRILSLWNIFLIFWRLRLKKPVCFCWLCKVNPRHREHFFCSKTNNP